jgi:hypothetical protein
LFSSVLRDFHRMLVSLVDSENDTARARRAVSLEFEWRA